MAGREELALSAHLAYHRAVKERWGHEMSDISQIVAGDSKEAVAYGLLLCIASAEGKILQLAGAALFKSSAADKEWILSTYRECLTVVE